MASRVNFHHETVIQPVRARRIALLHWALPPTVGGVESGLVDLITVLRSNGAQIIIVSGEKNPSTELFESVELHYSPALDLQLIRGGKAVDESLLCDFAKLLGFLQPDLVHAHNIDQFWLGPLRVLTELRKRYSYRLCHTYHLPVGLPGAESYLTVWNSHHAVSEFVAHEVQSRTGIKPCVLHLPVDSFRFVPQSDPLTHDVVRILHPGRMHPGKGFLRSISLLQCLIEDGVPAELVITDPLAIVDWDTTQNSCRRSVARAAVESGMADRITVVNADWRTMPSLYGSSDIVVHPSELRESLGIVPLEAMSCGIPLVCSNRGGAMETIVHGVTGFLIDIARPEALVHRVRALIADPDAARAMGQAARRHVRENFGFSRFRHGLEKIYNG